MTTREVADHLGIPVSTLYQWRHRKVGPRAAKIGRHLRWRQTEVERWVEQQTTSGSR